MTHDQPDAYHSLPQFSQYPQPPHTHPGGTGAPQPPTMSLQTDLHMEWPGSNVIAAKNNEGSSQTDSVAPSVTTGTESVPLDPNKPWHPEWGVLKEQDFHPLTLKHQRDLENLHEAGTIIADFYFWQANLGGYCMADMNQNLVVSSEGVYTLVRRIVEGAPHPGRRRRRRGMG